MIAILDIFAEVIINNEAVAIDKPFTYKVKEQDSDTIQVGHRVLVPFGFKNKLVEGFVIGLKCDIEEEIKKIKNVSKILDKEPILSRDDLQVIEFLRKRYLCKYIDAIRTIIPTGLLRGLSDKVKKVIVYEKDLDGKLGLKENYIKIMNFLKIHTGEYTRSELINEFNFSAYSLKKLIDEGFLSVDERVVYRYNNKVYKR